MPRDRGSMTPEGGADGYWRNPDRALVAGVCAGIAEKHHASVLAVRLAVVLAMAVAFPVVVVGYFVAVLMIPKASGAPASQAPAGAPSADQVQERFRRLEGRLRDLEAHVSSRDFQLKQAFKGLEGHR